MIYPKQYLYKRIVQAKLFIDANFVENINLNNISYEAIFSKFHFIRLFKKIYGKTPHQYLKSVRIEKAMEFMNKGIPFHNLNENRKFSFTESDHLATVTAIGIL